MNASKSFHLFGVALYSITFVFLQSATRPSSKYMTKRILSFDVNPSWYVKQRLHFAKKLLRSFRFPSNADGGLSFILSDLGMDDDDDAIFLVDAVNIGENFGGINGVVKVGNGGKGTGSVSRDKADTISAAFLSTAACSVVGICTSSIYSSLDSSCSCSKGSSSSSSSCSEDDSPIDGSRLSL